MNFLTFKDSVCQHIVTRNSGQLGRGTGSRNVGRHLTEIWYEGGKPLRDDRFVTCYATLIILGR
uniref:Uncharacterized protein n=1 Tax=Arundo donax TaxID=35708 RepID=A0A0A9DP78_ARUDO